MRDSHWLATDLGRLRKASHLLIQNCFNDDVEISGSAQLFHALRFRVDPAHGVKNHFQGCQILDTVHGRSTNSDHHLRAQPLTR